MGIIKISAKGIDELNMLYRKLKRDYKAQGSIHLNKESMEYQMELIRNDLDRSLQAICDKVIDADEMLDGESVFENFTIKFFYQQMDYETVVPSLRPLKAVWKDLTEEKRYGCFTYFCEELKIELEDEEDVGHSKLIA